MLSIRIYHVKNRNGKGGILLFSYKLDIHYIIYKEGVGRVNCSIKD